MPEMNVTSADTGAFDIDQNLARLQVSSSLHFLQTGLRLCNPEIMRGVGVNTNVCLGGLDLGAIGSAVHLENISNNKCYRMTRKKKKVTRREVIR